MARSRHYLTLFVLLNLAPACAPEKETQEASPPKKVVVLTDSTSWQPGGTVETKVNRLRKEKVRLLISGSPGETGEDLIARLPWLLQPGLDTLYYDANLAGEATADSLRTFLRAQSHPAIVKLIARQGRE